MPPRLISTKHISSHFPALQEILRSSAIAISASSSLLHRYLSSTSCRALSTHYCCSHTSSCSHVHLKAPLFKQRAVVASALPEDRQPIISPAARFQPRCPEYSSARRPLLHLSRSSPWDFPYHKDQSLLHVHHSDSWCSHFSPPLQALDDPVVISRPLSSSILVDHFAPVFAFTLSLSDSFFPLHLPRDGPHSLDGL